MEKLLWEPSEERKKQANMTRFLNFVAERYGQKMTDYNELYRWSVENITDFWAAMWEFGEVLASRPYERVLDNPGDMLEARWFAGAELNFAENLLRYRDQRTALIFQGEGLPEVRRMTYAELYDRVARLADSLRKAGVAKDDRVAGLMPNLPETVIAMLATTSIGAVWSSCSPDFGLRGVLDRFGQIQPKVLFVANGYSYNGKKYDCLQKAGELASHLPGIEKVIVVPYTEQFPDISGLPRAVLYDDFISDAEGLEISFEQLPFNHPIYVMYSSGTTGIPKCIVHGAGGTLIQHLKELMLHTDLTRKDTVFYYTTCGWMMWNWLVSSLAVGATLVLYDGSPFYPTGDALWQMAQDLAITVFGTSAKYLESLEKEGIRPGEKFDLSKIKTVLSTGSPLSVPSFEFVYREIKKDLCLSSISGGTDIISCFALGNPIGPVYAGELQCRGLGMKVESFDSEGRPLIAQKGEMVCRAPFPSMPVGFWNDPGKEKYRQAYFNVYPNTWRHGDYIEINERGGVVIHGRSDATLNPGGVRIGTAEIYRQVESLPEIKDSIVVGQNWENDIRVILFVKLKEGILLTDELVLKIRNTIRENATPRHVPAKIISVKDIPYTLSGKKVEMAVRSIIHGEEVKNRDALANPEALEYFRNLPELQDKKRSA